MLTATVEATTEVVILKFALELPAGIVTLAGTDAAALFDEPSAMVAPPCGAVPLRVTVPTDVSPPVTVDGLTEMPDNTAELIVSVALALEAPSVAVM